MLVIGAGSTGAAIAHDLTLRGLLVTVLDRGGVASGTTGHNQGQLHSGARYAVSDPAAARECQEENEILRRILPGGMELNDGLFVALCDDHLAYREAFLEGCARCGIQVRDVPMREAFELEPRLNPRSLAALRVADGVFDPFRLCLAFLATAASHGAVLRTFAQVVGLESGTQVREKF